MARLDRESPLPPWLTFPEIERYSLGWRMGAGESYDELWHFWAAKRSRDALVTYFREFAPVPIQWADWVAFKLTTARLRGALPRRGRTPEVESIADLGLFDVVAWRRSFAEPRWPHSSVLPSVLTPAPTSFGPCSALTKKGTLRKKDRPTATLDRSCKLFDGGLHELWSGRSFSISASCVRSSTLRLSSVISASLAADCSSRDAAPGLGKPLVAQVGDQPDDGPALQNLCGQQQRRG